MNHMLLARMRAELFLPQIRTRPNGLTTSSRRKATTSSNSEMYRSSRTSAGCQDRHKTVRPYECDNITDVVGR